MIEDLSKMLLKSKSSGTYCETCSAMFGLNYTRLKLKRWHFDNVHFLSDKKSEQEDIETLRSSLRLPSVWNWCEIRENKFNSSWKKFFMTKLNYCTSSQFGETMLNSHAFGLTYCLGCRYGRCTGILVFSYAKSNLIELPKNFSHKWVRQCSWGYVIYF